MQHDTLAGAWRATVHPDGRDPIRNDVVVHPDGTLTNHDPFVAGGVGAWTQVEGRVHRAHIVHGNVYDGSGTNLLDQQVAPGTVTVDVHLEVDLAEDGATASGRYRTELLGVDGQPVMFADTDTPAVLQGEIRWERVEVDRDVTIPGR